MNSVRTTVELKPEHRARLLEISARRGEKGFSQVLGEAIEQYLKTGRERESQINKALKLRGSLSEAEADHFEQVLQEIRASWR